MFPPYTYPGPVLPQHLGTAEYDQFIIAKEGKHAQNVTDNLRVHKKSTVKLCL